MYESVMPYTEHLEKYIEDKPILFYILKTQQIKKYF